MNPLSIPFNPLFSPNSPKIIPGYGSSVLGSRTGVTKPCSPWQVPSAVQSCANSKAYVQVLPRFPIQHLAPWKSGVCITNSWVDGSYVAVVLICFVLLPWPTSVKAMQLKISPRHAALYRGKWRSVPRLRIALANKETPTANLTDTFKFNAAIASLRIIMVRVFFL